ncbi:MAG: 16S rRNA (guanine(966)-N(2))-methyltransferase RsmD [Pseudomonadota bacterium]
MRIIAGKARGRRLYVPGTFAVRPTAERIKGAFFNIIGLVDGKTFLDLFAGSGNMGLEALSRGALKAVFVENNRALIDAIGRNIETCSFGGKGEILSSDFIKAIQVLVKRSENFDILFADPPYERGIVSQTLEHLRNGSLMEKGGLLAVQHSAREVAAVDESGQLVLTDRRQYGDTILSFFKKRD